MIEDFLFVGADSLMFCFTNIGSCYGETEGNSSIKRWKPTTLGNNSNRSPRMFKTIAKVRKLVRVSGKIY